MDAFGKLTFPNRMLKKLRARSQANDKLCASERALRQNKVVSLLRPLNETNSLDCKYNKKYEITQHFTLA